MRWPARGWAENWSGNVCGHLLGYASGRTNGYLYGDAQDGEIDLTDPAKRHTRLQQFAAMFCNSILPWFDEASNPDLIVTSRAGDYTHDPVSLVEWLANRNRPELIHGYVQRILTRDPGSEASHHEGASTARHGQPDPGRGMVSTATALGWSVTKLTEP